MHKEINSERKKKGTAPVTVDKNLSTKAKARADELCKKSQWSHDGWRNAFKDTAYKHYGENLARGFKSTKATMESLMKSPTHKANILNKNFKNVGLGKKNCKGKVISVQLFGG